MAKKWASFSWSNSWNFNRGVNEFRLMSVFSITSFWMSLGLIFALFWNRFILKNETTSHYN